jgi:type VI secretion system protein ImpM
MRGLGLLGKLPSHGDFLCRNLPTDLTRPLNRWLAATVAASRDALGDRWLGAFLEAPIWRFALAHGICGRSAAAGIWLPSVDRVGRYFPLLIVAPLDRPLAPTALLHRAGPWYDRLQGLALALLDGGLVPADLDARLADADPPVIEDLVGMPWRMTLSDAAGWRLADIAPVGSLWWGDGSPLVPASLLACAGLPPPGTFAAMLDGGFASHGWTELPGRPGGVGLADEEVI